MALAPFSYLVLDNLGKSCQERTYTLAYIAAASATTKKKSFVTLTPGTPQAMVEHLPRRSQAQADETGEKRKFFFVKSCHRYLCIQGISIDIKVI